MADKKRKVGEENADDFEQKDFEFESDELVIITVPLEDAVTIAIGGSIENAILKRKLRNEIVSQCGADAYMAKQDEINEKQGNLIQVQRTYISRLEIEADALRAKIKSKANKKSNKKGGFDDDGDDDFDN